MVYNIKKNNYYTTVALQSCHFTYFSITVTDKLVQTYQYILLSEILGAMAFW